MAFNVNLWIGILVHTRFLGVFPAWVTLWVTNSLENLSKLDFHVCQFESPTLEWNGFQAKEHPRVWGAASWLHQSLCKVTMASNEGTHQTADVNLAQFSMLSIGGLKVILRYDPESYWIVVSNFRMHKNHLESSFKMPISGPYKPRDSD